MSKLVGAMMLLDVSVANFNMSHVGGDGKIMPGFVLFTTFNCFQEET